MTADQEKEKLPYKPSKEEEEHIASLLKKKDELSKYWKPFWGEVEESLKLYPNDQLPVRDGDLPEVDLPEEIKMVETKVADELKTLPEAVLEGKSQADRIKIEALEFVIGQVDRLNKNDILELKKLFHKNIEGAAVKKIYFKESYRTIKIVTGVEKPEDNTAPKIPKLKWKEVQVVNFKDIAMELVPLQNLCWTKGVSLDDAVELFEEKHTDYETAKQEFGMFDNFQFVEKKQYSQIASDTLNSLQRNVELEKECHILLYWNKPKDEYSIMLNGVLLTQFGNPIPYDYWKDFPFTFTINRYIPYRPLSKSDVQILKPFKRQKNILRNSIQQAVVTNSHAPLIVPEEAGAQFENFEWQHLGIIEVESVEEAQSIRPLQVNVDISGAMALDAKIDDDTTITLGVDPRSLLHTANETATKTASRTENVQKRISVGIKLMEYDSTLREKQLKIALIKQFYQDKVFYPYEGQEAEAAPQGQWKFRTVPIKSKVFEWKEFGEVKWEKGIASVIPRWELQSGEAEDPKAVHDLEIRPELFDIRYEVSVRPASRLPYGELYEQEQADTLYERLMQNPNINQQELLRLYLDKKFMDFDKYDLIMQPQIPMTQGQNLPPQNLQ